MTDLFPYNTLRVHANANRFIELNSPDQKFPTDEPLLFLGAGANILFTKDFPGCVAKINFSGIKVIKETDADALVEAAAGQNWHELVMWSVNHNLSGLENMALIPGTVGGAAIGNIAAYGGNQEDVLVSVQASSQTFQKTDCKFSYRHSYFKNHSEYLVTSVIYRLSKQSHPDTSYHDRYTSLAAELAKIATLPYSVKDISQAVINIRQSKLPNMDQVGTAGSFFKNPLIPNSQYSNLKSQIPDLQSYPAEKLLYQDPSPTDQFVKIPAGRLLDKLGWKGKTIGRVSTSPNQALYVINLGGATGAEIYEYAELMRADIKKHFDINLEYEVQII